MSQVVRGGNKDCPKEFSEYWEKHSSEYPANSLELVRLWSLLLPLEFGLDLSVSIL